MFTDRVQSRFDRARDAVACARMQALIDAATEASPEPFASAGGNFVWTLTQSEARRDPALEDRVRAAGGEWADAGREVLVKLPRSYTERRAVHFVPELRAVNAAFFILFLALCALRW